LLAAAIVTFGASAAFAQQAGAPQPNPEQVGFCAQVKNPSAHNTCVAARSEFYKGKYTLSLRMMKQALNTSPKESILRAEIARVMLQMRAEALAERELRQARLEGVRDQDILPLLFLAMVRGHKEITLLNEFPEPAPGAKGAVAAIVLQGRAMALRSTDQFAAAAAAMDRSLSLNRSVRGLLVRAGIATAQKDTALARKLVDEAYGLAPNDDVVMTAKLRQLVESDDMAATVALAERMQKLYPIYSTPSESKIRVFLSHNQDAKAAAEIKSYLALRPKSPLMAYFTAVLKSRAHDKTRASEIVMVLPPDFIRSYPQYAIQMAQIMLDTGHTEAASSALGIALGAAPDLLEVRLRLAAVRMEQNRPQSAMQLLSPVKDIQDPRVQSLISKVQTRIAKDRSF
jgi:tetratricopeptide (TPR) repeat protein